MKIGWSTLSEIPYKPKGSPLWETLKELKNGFDDRSLDYLESTLLRGARLAQVPMFISLRGEVIHQVALRCARRGEITKARSLFEESLATFKDSEVLGRARVLRDFGLFLCENGEPQAGLAAIREALSLHDRDFRNDKSQRQRRITLSYLWRGQILTGDDDGNTLDLLTQYALEGCLDCSYRDQYFVVKFAYEHAPLAQRTALNARLMDIHADRGKPLLTLVTITRLVIDAELDMAGRIVGGIVGRLVRIIRKE